MAHKDGGHILVDLDATLARYDQWEGIDKIGEPVPAMLARVKDWRAKGIEVRIFTARVAGEDAEAARGHIDAWTERHVGEVLPVTCRKTFGAIEIWDDRCVQVVPNVGLPVEAVLGVTLQAVTPLVTNPTIIAALAPARKALAGLAHTLGLLPPRVGEKR